MFILWSTLAQLLFKQGEGVVIRLVFGQATIAEKYTTEGGSTMARKTVLGVFPQSKPRARLRLQYKVCIRLRLLFA